MPRERDQRILPVKNTTNEMIPAYAVMLISESGGGEEYMEVKKPDIRSEGTQDINSHCFNLSRPILPGKFGDATMDYPVRALIENEEDVDSDEVTHQNYSIVKDKWAVSRRPRIWRALPALQAITAPAGKSPEAMTIKAMPAIIHPALPPLFVKSTYNDSLGTSFAKIDLTLSSLFSSWHGGYWAVGGWGSWGYGWGYGWSGNDPKLSERYGLKFNETQKTLIVQFDSDFQISLSAYIASELVTPGDPDDGIKTITLAAFVNGEETDIKATWNSLDKTGNGEIATLTLEEGDKIDVRAKISKKSTGDIDLRRTVLRIEPVFDEDGTL